MCISRVLVVAVLLGLVPTTYAGLYNPAEPDEGKLYPDEFAGQFLPNTLIPLQTAGVQRQKPGDPFFPLGTRHLLIDEDGAGRLSRRTVLERLSLSAYLIRKGQPRLADPILEELLRENPKNFVAAANQMTAYYLMGLPLVDRRHETKVMKHWPEKMEDLPKEMQRMLSKMGWDEKSIAGSKFARLRRAEKYFQKLLSLRSLEDPIKLERSDHMPDALFGDALRFDKGDASYKVGGPPANGRGALPEDAVEIVQQLLVWLPTDTRLLWLLGEVYNAQGDIRNAKAVFRHLTKGLNAPYGGPHQPPLLARHVEALSKHKAERTTVSFPEKVEPEAGKGKQPEQAARIPVDWRSLLVGFGAGIVVSYIGYWQIRQMTKVRKK